MKVTGKTVTDMDLVSSTMQTVQNMKGNGLTTSKKDSLSSVMKTEKFSKVVSRTIEWLKKNMNNHPLRNPWKILLLV